VACHLIAAAGSLPVFGRVAAAPRWQTWLLVNVLASFFHGTSSSSQRPFCEMLTSGS
jgi:hypothetical protein